MAWMLDRRICGAQIVRLFLARQMDRLTVQVVSCFHESLGDHRMAINQFAELPHGQTLFDGQRRCVDNLGCVIANHVDTE